MRTRLTALAMSTLAYLLLAPPICAQTVTNVLAQQLTDGTKRVEILYDLSGAAAEGATVTVAISGDGGATYAIAPVPGSLAGDVAGVASGANRRIVWDPAASVPAGSYGTNYRASVTATNPSSGGQEITYTLPGGVPLVLVRIPAGTFQMGAPESERSSYDGERPVHQVTLTSDYYIGKYEVTQAQWHAVMGTNPSYFTSCGGSCPVERVSWDDIRGENGFLAKLNQLLGTTKFRLPTEAEWERAARGGTQTRFSFGDALGGDDYCGANAESEPYLWWCGNSGNTTHAVGTKGANPYAVFDMHGNVFEWVEDWIESYPTTAETNPTGPATGSIRVYRGGSWSSSLPLARSASRCEGDAFHYPGNRHPDLGFRLARSL
ncbi:MAG: formylglycine-generating enzyme family protein [Thermoanaerobaculia bacterium]